MVDTDSRVGRWLPIFPMPVCKPNLSSLKIAGKSVRMFKTKGIAEMQRFHCMLAYIRSQTNVLESKQKIAYCELSKEICFH